MNTQITPHFLDLLFDSLLKSFWRKNALARFSREFGISEAFVAALRTETKRDVIERLFVKLERHPSRLPIFSKMAHALAEQKTFPDLEGWEDSSKMIADAKRSVSSLAKYLEQQKRETESVKEREKVKELYRRNQVKARASSQQLEILGEQLTLLFPNLGTQEGGYNFQEWFYNFLDFHEIPLRRPYVTNGRQIDGSVTLSGTTCLVELKFTRSRAASPDMDTFIRKVTTKADNTMGIFVSMSDFNSNAVVEASKDRSPILLLDSSHIYHALSAAMSFVEIVARVRRHASQTGSAYLKINDFSG